MAHNRMEPYSGYNPYQAAPYYGSPYQVPPAASEAANRAISRLKGPGKKIARKSTLWWATVKLRRFFGRHVDVSSEFQEKILPDILAHQNDIAIAAARGAEVVLPMVARYAGNWADQQERQLYGHTSGNYDPNMTWYRMTDWQ